MQRERIEDRKKKGGRQIKREGEREEGEGERETEKNTVRG